MSRKRDYKAEYQRRIANAEKRGLSRSQARGHAKAGEAKLKPTLSATDLKLIDALASFEQNNSIAGAAKAAGISPERLRRFIQDEGLASKAQGRWSFTSKPYCEMLVIANGEMTMMKLASFQQASFNGRYLNAAQRFFYSNDRDHLTPFAGAVVIDAKGQAHPLETDPNSLLRIWHRDADFFPEIYRLIS